MAASILLKKELLLKKEAGGWKKTLVEIRSKKIC